MFIPGETVVVLKDFYFTDFTVSDDLNDSNQAIFKNEYKIKEGTVGCVAKYEKKSKNIPIIIFDKEKSKFDIFFIPKKNIRTVKKQRIILNVLINILFVCENIYFILIPILVLAIYMYNKNYAITKTLSFIGLAILCVCRIIQNIIIKKTKK